MKGRRKGHKFSQETKDKISKKLSRPKIEFKCDQCETPCIESPASYNSSKNHFCSHRCHNQFRKEYYINQRKDDPAFSLKKRDYMASANARRYALLRAAQGSHSLEEWNSIKEQFNNCCCFCGKEAKLTKDHIVPLSNGGTNYIENIQPACRSCNSKKKVKIINMKVPMQKYIDYVEENGYLVLTKLELNDIIKNAKLGKVPVVNPKGKIVGWRE